MDLSLRCKFFRFRNIRTLAVFPAQISVGDIRLFHMLPVLILNLTLLLFTLLFSWPSIAQSSSMNNELRGTITSFKGAVKYLPAGSGGWLTLPENAELALNPDDQLEIPSRGSCHITFSDTIKVLVGSRSRLRISPCGFKLFRGLADVSAGLPDTENTDILSLETPGTEIRALHARYEVSVNPEGLSEIKVADGSIQVKLKRRIQTVEKGYGLTVDRNGQAGSLYELPSFKEATKKLQKK